MLIFYGQVATLRMISNGRLHLGVQCLTSPKWRLSLCPEQYKCTRSALKSLGRLLAKLFSRSVRAVPWCVLFGGTSHFLPSLEFIESLLTITRMVRWIFRIYVRSRYGKGFLFGFLLLFVLFNQSNFDPKRHEESKSFSNEVNSQERQFKPENKYQQYNITSKHEPPLQNADKPRKKKPILQDENDWKEVFGSNKEYFVYSAFYDTRQPKKPAVRIITIIQRRVKIRQCLLYYEDGSSVQVSATSTSIKEGWTLKYVASFVLCDASNKGYSPVWVSIVKDSVTLLPSFKVVDLTKRSHEGFISVCVKPFHYEYNRALWLVEFIELHRLLGVDKFFFYNHTVGFDVEDILNYYIESNVVTVLPWNLPVKSQSEIRTEGIFAALNDCNLRNVGRYNYTIMIDLDEYIIPRNYSNYKEMLHDLGQHNSYTFQNVFYYMYWENDTTVNKKLYSETGIGTQLYGSEDEGPYLLTAYKTYRTTKINSHGQRSKYIADPHKVIECGNHVAWQFTDTKKGLRVKKEIALMNHYRICEGGGFSCIKRPREIDRAAHKWLHPLIKKIAETCSAVFLKDRHCPAAPGLGNPW